MSGFFIQNLEKNQKLGVILAGKKWGLLVTAHSFVMGSLSEDVEKNTGSLGENDARGLNSLCVTSGMVMSPGHFLLLTMQYLGS